VAKEPTALGKLIQQAMARSGIEKQAELADQTGFSGSTISRLIYDPIEPQYSTLATLAQLFRIDIETLMSAARGQDVEMQPFHPLGAELDRMLADDSPLPQQTKDNIAQLVNMVLDQHRDAMRQARRAV
jgi:transcriptional regulator with XRE-family HTH domain